jgi:hypothetical protein
MSKSHDELPSLDPSQLSAVTGGVTTDTTSTDLTTLMTQLESSLTDLSQNQGGSSMNQFMEMLPLMMMMRNESASAAPPLVEYPPEIPPPIGNGSGWTLV